MIKRLFAFFCAAFFIVGFVSCNSSDDSADNYELLTPENGEELSGGGNTSFNYSPEAFGFAAPELSFDERINFGVGNSFFNQNWVSAPSSTTVRDGLGPLFNARNCAACHFKDGRGRPPAFDGEISHGLLLRLSIPGVDAHGGNLPEPNYGGQFQDNAILNISKEGNIIVTYSDLVVSYNDGTSVALQKPTYSFSGLNYGAMAGNLQVSPRVANQMIGLGLLDAIPEVTILSFADENDRDGDGISGRPNYVYDIASNSTKMGRFGWKANQPNIKQQVAAAFAGDLGITNSLMPNDNCPPNVNCNDIPNGGSPEIDDVNLNNVSFYATTLAVPARRDFATQDVLRGKQIFVALECAKCHIPKIQTGSYNVAALSNQTIRPYTDMLLHDMGEDLADNSPDFLATGREWRTQPLWGIGLIKTVNGHTNLLHDGRARNVEEAILWHGGEALKSKKAFRALSSDDRKKLINFINTL